MLNHARPLALILVAAAPALGQEAPPEMGETGEATVTFDRRAAEHLLNRAGFGATPEAIDAAVEVGLEATVDELFLAGGGPLPQEAPERLVPKDGMGGGFMKEWMDEDERRKARSAMRRADRQQLTDYTVWWFDTMAAGADPLRDRMTLFWHGYFTSSQQDVKSSYRMIEQNQLLREHALGSFRDLLHGVAKDPAMLEYLDNDENKKKEPNENFAREVMELFTLGEGNYTEEDIKEAARAFTGWRAKASEFVNNERQHDSGKKTVLGVSGKLDGGDVLEILLDQETCATYVAGRLIEYLEGAAPAPERHARYADLLRAEDYALEPFLRELFVDPDFYREAIVGQRVAGPVDLLVGMARRLDLEPPTAWYLAGSELLGQKLFYPPSVKGWDEGMAWITTASLMHRGNLAGILLGTVDVSEVLSDQDEMFQGDMDSMTDMQGESMEAAAKPKGFGVLNGIKGMRGSWDPRLNLAKGLRRADARTSEEVVEYLADALLAVEIGPDTRAMLVAELEARKAEARATGRQGESARSGRFRGRARGDRADEEALHELAHLMLCLPEAQLH